MATGGEVGGTREHSSDVVQDYTCPTCSKSGKTTEASHYCPDCDVCYCKICLCDHVVIGRSKVDQWGKGTRAAGKTGNQSEEDEVKCIRHPKNEIELYCEDHDVLCCRLCPSTDHRSCTNMEQITIAAEEHDLDDTIEYTLEQIYYLESKAERLSKDSYMRKRFTEGSHTTYVRQLREMKDKIDAKFGQITEESNRRKQHYIDKCNMDHFMCDEIKDIIPKLETALEPLPDKAKYFIKAKRTKEWVEEKNDEMEKILETEVTGIFKHISKPEEKDTLNLVTDVLNVKMTAEMAFSVLSKEDESESEIVGICQIANGNIILADQANKCLKQMDGAYIVINRYALQESPRGVCAVGEAEVAVAMENKKVLIVAVGTQFEIVQSLDMDHCCSQVAYHNGHLFVTDISPCNGSCMCRTQLYIYDKSGNLVNKFIVADSKHNPSDHRPVTVSPDGQRIFVARSQGFLISLDLEGNTVAKSSTFTGILGLCVDEHGYLYISDRSSQQVIKSSQTGTEGFKKVKIVKSSGRGPTSPRAICYDKNLDRVAICDEKGDYVYLS